MLTRNISNTRKLSSWNLSFLNDDSLRPIKHKSLPPLLGEADELCSSVGLLAGWPHSNFLPILHMANRFAMINSDFG